MADRHADGAEIEPREARVTAATLPCRDSLGLPARRVRMDRPAVRELSSAINDLPLAAQP